MFSDSAHEKANSMINNEQDNMVTLVGNVLHQPQLIREDHVQSHRDS